MPRRSRGFSLMEIMVVVAIIGLVSAMVLITFSSNRRDTELDQEAERLDALFSYVREQAEWDNGHLKAAQLVPLSLLGKDGAALPATLPKDKPLYLHCRSGSRSLKAAEILKAKGYDARPLGQGYGQLVKDGFEKAE